MIRPGKIEKCDTSRTALALGNLETYNYTGKKDTLKCKGHLFTLPSSKQEHYGISYSKYPQLNPLRKLTMQLVATYTHITEVYYIKKRKLQNSSQQAPPNNMWDDQHHDYIWHPNEILFDRYELFQKIGKGSFGQVISAYDRVHNQPVAIKIIKSRKAFMTQALTEIDLLQELNAKDPQDKHFIVRLLHTFMYRGHQCLVFEYLSYNLYEILRNSQFKGISLNLLRKFTRQILKALKFLALPDYSQIKVIDFGSSCRSSSTMFSYIQSRFYRAPEVLLGLKYSVAIDMWSLGCILVEMHTGDPLFGGDDQVDQMRKIIQVLGMPPDSMIRNSRLEYSQLYFDEKVIVGEDGSRTTQYVFKPDEGESFQDIANTRNLEDIVGMHSGGPYGRRRNEQGHSPHHYRCFLDLIECMLVYDPNKRITPTEALKHPFLLKDEGTRKIPRSTRRLYQNDGSKHSRG